MLSPHVNPYYYFIIIFFIFYLKIYQNMGQKLGSNNLQPQTHNFHRLPTVISRFLTQINHLNKIITQNHHLYLKSSKIN
jgi:hypothetical protein